jgi:hypothetical protein
LIGVGQQLTVSLVLARVNIPRVNRTVTFERDATLVFASVSPFQETQRLIDGKQTGRVFQSDYLGFPRREFGKVRMLLELQVISEVGQWEHDEGFDLRKRRISYEKGHFALELHRFEASFSQQ